MQVSAGALHTCCVAANSSLVCWGANMHGQVLLAHALAHSLYACAPPPPLRALSFSHQHFLYVRSSICKPGTRAFAQSSPPVSSGYVAVGAGLTFTCALRSTTGTDNFGRIECFGHAFSSSSSWSAPAPPSPAPSPQKHQVGAAEVTSGTAASRPSVPHSLSKRDCVSVHVGHAHVCVTDAVDLSLNCYAVGGPATIRAAAAQV